MGSQGDIYAAQGDMMGDGLEGIAATILFFAVSRREIRKCSPA
ncbi:MAG: hypothetical protein PVH30_11910 [Desulfobacterales bacterium]